MTSLILEARAVTRRYSYGKRLLYGSQQVTVVDNLSLILAKGETLGIVGESGSGKSTTARMLLGSEAPDSGSVLFEGAPMPVRGTPEWRRLRPRLQMIFQDPLAALDPRMTVLSQITEPLEIHRPGQTEGNVRRVAEVMDAVGLSTEMARRYPHELSGGQRQRAVLARALTTRPDLLICDEPVSALDVSIQAQVVNLLSDLQRDLRLAMIFISHDLRVVRQISHRVAVMYLGRIVEEGDADDIFAAPVHPYTAALVSAAPVAGRASTSRIMLEGEPPDPARRPTGCVFHPRCPSAQPVCGSVVPPLVTVAVGRRAACHLVPALPTQPPEVVS
jgi:peptide/nickel transport system ATP-binding protein